MSKQNFLKLLKNIWNNLIKLSQVSTVAGILIKIVSGHCNDILSTKKAVSVQFFFFMFSRKKIFLTQNQWSVWQMFLDSPDGVSQIYFFKLIFFFWLAFLFEYYATMWFILIFLFYPSFVLKKKYGKTLFLPILEFLIFYWFCCNFCLFSHLQDFYWLFQCTQSFCA